MKSTASSDYIIRVEYARSSCSYIDYNCLKIDVTPICEERKYITAAVPSAAFPCDIHMLVKRILYREVIYR